MIFKSGDGTEAVPGPDSGPAPEGALTPNGRLGPESTLTPDGALLAGWRLTDGHALAVTRTPGGLRLIPAVRDRGNWRPAAPGDGTAAAFATALMASTEPPPGFRTVSLAPTRPHEHPRSDHDGARQVLTGAAERGLTVDQTNESVVVGERLMVKWLPRPEQRPHPAPAMLAHLAETGFTSSPAPRAALWWSPQDEPEALLALVADYLPDAQDGWDWCVDDLLADWQGGPPAAFPAGIGVLVADLHAALGAPSVTFPQPTATVGQGQITAWARDAANAVDKAVACTTGADGVWLRAHAPLLHAAVLDTEAASTLVLNIHGDLHVGQVLRWRDGLAVTDFDGNPAVSGAAPLQPAARDIAQMLTSLEHVAQIANRRSDWQRTRQARAFAKRAGEEFLGAYRSRLEELGMAYILDERLLRPFAVEQECRELIYAARFLPRWTYAPMGVLRSWYDNGEET